MGKERKILWTDLHSNIHHEEIDQLPKWFEHAKEVLDFWAIAYYPYYMKKLESGMPTEDKYPLQEITEDWNYIRNFVNEVNQAGYPLFMGFEWQGSGKDGDHNVFFKNNDSEMEFPLRYQELYELYKDTDAVAIPHHLAYQLNERGKNWDTHIESFSPFVEIYSSHGSSENDYGHIHMNRHIHMGPRVGTNCVEMGLARGYKFGVIASGDNHSVPAVCEFGTMAVISEDNTKEAIWEAMMNRHVYGVSNEKIKLHYGINGKIMGDCAKFIGNDQIDIKIEASNSLDRIEVIGDNEVIELISCHHKPEIGNHVRFKFKLEFGWGPDCRIFEDIVSKVWVGSLQTKGEIISVEKCWNSFGQKIISQSAKQLNFELTTYKTTQTGKWMGTAGVNTEGFIIEIETRIEEELIFIVDGKKYQLLVRDILDNSKLFGLTDEVNKLIYEHYQETEFYRNDTWWHNSYKFKVHKGCLYSEYNYNESLFRDLRAYQNIRLRVHQKNGCLAWSSPIFKEEE